MARVQRICLVCNYSCSTIEDKESYKEVITCPNCKSALVDSFRIAKYMDRGWKPNKKMDKQLDDISNQDIIDAVEYAYKQRINSTPMTDQLLTIEFQEETSTPVVYYKGERIENLRELQLDWDADDNVSYGGLTYAIEYAEKGNNYPTNHRIEREVKGHAD